MLVELAILLSSCNATGVALGVCSNQCPTSQGASYTICAEREVKTESSKNPARPKPKRLCSYYVNGTIDQPTGSIITAWVEVGSRPCIGDKKVESVPVVKTSTDLIQEIFTAHAQRPFAFMNPSGTVEITEPVNFGVNTGGGSHLGELFGSAAEIRFLAQSVSWQFSDGQTRLGRYVSVSFADPQKASAVARVGYRIDYRLLGSNWVIGASSASLESNRLDLEVVDPPRRSLLRD